MELPGQVVAAGEQLRPGSLRLGLGLAHLDPGRLHGAAPGSGGGRCPASCRRGRPWPSRPRCPDRRRPPGADARVATARPRRSERGPLNRPGHPGASPATPTNTSPIGARAARAPPAPGHGSAMTGRRRAGADIRLATRAASRPPATASRTGAARWRPVPAGMDLSGGAQATRASHTRLAGTAHRPARRRLGSDQQRDHCALIMPGSAAGCEGSQPTSPYAEDQRCGR